MANKYKGVATLLWDMESDNPNIEAAEYIESVLKYIPEEIRKNLTLKVHAHCVFEKLPKKVVLAEFSPEDVLPYIYRHTHIEERTYTVEGIDYKVRMTSERYKLFERDKCTCVCCGLIGTKMILEKDRQSPRYHFNLYGEEDGKNILFTKDHIIPAAHGGQGNNSNFQTMCQLCNLLKGCAKHLSMEKLREMRQAYKDALKQGKAIASIEHQKMSLDVKAQEIIADRHAKALSSTLAKEKAQQPLLQFVEDIQVWLLPGGEGRGSSPPSHIGLPASKKKPPGKKAAKIFLFQANSLVKPAHAKNNNIYIDIPYEDGKYFRVDQTLLNCPIESKEPCL